MKKILAIVVVMFFAFPTISVVFAENVVDPEVIETPQPSPEALKSCSGSEENCYQLPSCT
jgi:hypothetical protein